jgi:hypothetical protein
MDNTISKSAAPSGENLWLPLVAALFVLGSGLTRIAFRLATNFQTKTMAETLPILVGRPIILIYFAVRTGRGEESMRRFFQYVAVSAGW